MRFYVHSVAVWVQFHQACYFCLLYFWLQAKIVFHWYWCKDCEWHAIYVNTLHAAILASLERTAPNSHWTLFGIALRTQCLWIASMGTQYLACHANRCIWKRTQNGICVNQGLNAFCEKAVVCSNWQQKAEHWRLPLSQLLKQNLGSYKLLHKGGGNQYNEDFQLLCLVHLISTGCNEL